MYGCHQEFKVRHYFQVSIIFIALWLLWSQQISAHYLVAGLISVCISLWILFRTNTIFLKENTSAPVLSTIRYLFWLHKETMASACRVTKIIWRAKNFYSAAFIERDVSVMASEKAKVAYANSITITPGTISVCLEKDKLIVHVLSGADMDLLKTGNKMQQKVNQLYRANK